TTSETQACPRLLAMSFPILAHAPCIGVHYELWLSSDEKRTEAEEAGRHDQNVHADDLGVTYTVRQRRSNFGTTGAGTARPLSVRLQGGDGGVGVSQATDRRRQSFLLGNPERRPSARLPGAGGTTGAG